MEITLYDPHPKQLEIHKALSQDDVKYVIVPTGRQFGKSLLGENQAVIWALNQTNWNILWISPTYKQAKKVFRDIKNNLGDCPAYSHKPNQQDLIFFFSTGSTIKFYSAEAYDSIRGESAHAVICDEFRDFKPEAWTEAIKPTLTVTGKKVLIISTTKGKGLFHTLYQLGKQGHKGYVSFTATSYDNPHANIDEIEDAKETLPDHIFRQEYLAEFLDDGSGVFVNVQECIKEADKPRRYYAGIDLGRADDYTVLTIVNEKDQEVYCERWRRKEWSEIVNKIVQVLNKYKPSTYVEANGTQDAIYEMIRNKVNFGKGSIQPFITTTKTKPEIIENLIVKFEKKEVSILGKDWQVSELNSFSYEYNPKTRKLKYSAPVGLHDDYVMSRAITSHAVKKNKNYGHYNIV